jgi:hypothetical protein
MSPRLRKAMNAFHMCLPVILDSGSGSPKKKHGRLESVSKETVKNRVKKPSTLHPNPVNAKIHSLQGQKRQTTGAKKKATHRR